MSIRMRRSALLADSVRQFARLSATDLRKTFRFTFVGEPGLDAGGLTRCVVTVCAVIVPGADLCCVWEQGVVPGDYGGAVQH